MGFRITTWNVNGIRNPFGYQPWRDKRSFEAMFDILEADILIMQETKIQRKDLQDDMVLVPGWDVFFSLPKFKKGYSGVAIYTRNSSCAPIRAEEGITGILCPPKSTTSFRNLPKHQQIGGYPRPGQLDTSIDEATLDSEGRCVILEFPAFVLFGVYSPANRDDSRDEFRASFFHALDVRVRNLVEEGKQVILTGDLNVIRAPIDSTNVAETLRKEGISLEEWMAAPVRRIFNQMVFEGWVVTGACDEDRESPTRDQGREPPVLWDLCRCFHPDREGMNTCWDTKRNTRPANNGSRIDYVLCTAGLKDWFTYANIQEGLMGSDHCPVFVTLAEHVAIGDTTRSLSDVLNPPGAFVDGVRQREWSVKDLLPMSARLIPDFDRRQSIRDMFTKKAASSLSQQVSDTAGASNTPSSEDPVPEPLQSDKETPPSQEVPLETGAVVQRAETVSFSAPKRFAETADATPRPQKKGKTSTNGQDAKSKAASGQRTLQGFFKPKATTAQGQLAQRSSVSTSAPSSSATSADTFKGTTPPSQQNKTPAPVTSPRRSPSRVFDPIEAKESWSKLLTKRVAPRCEHEEPCISLTTKKAGINCGRSFYICARPLGPSGEKEKGSEWRCGTFIWSSDWNGSST